MGAPAAAESRRGPTGVSVVVAVLVAVLALSGAFVGGLGDAAAAQRKVCAGQFAFATKCEVKPRTLGVGVKGKVAGIDWRRWGGGKAVGFGRLTVAGFAGEPGTGIGPTRGRVKLDHLVDCRGKRWYSRITIKYGRGLDKTYVRDSVWFDCQLS